MQIALRCGKCGNIFKNNEDDLCLEIDFQQKKISYICRNANCRHDNIMDFGDWQNKQKHSPLPKIAVMRG